jgi:hypothetical protein
MKKGLNGHSYPFENQYHHWRVDHAFLSKHEHRLAEHSVTGERPKSVVGWVYLRHDDGCDGRDEEFEDSCFEIDFSVVD